MKYLFTGITLASLLFVACSTDETKNGEAKLLNYDVSPTCLCKDKIEDVQLDFQINQVHIFSKDDLKTTEYPVDFTPIVEVSPGATILPGANEQISFSSIDDVVNYQITSEDGEALSEWYVRLRDKQLPSSDFETWHDAYGMEGTFRSPGADEFSTIWATANAGTSMYSVYGTIPVTEGENTMVKIITGQTVAVPVTAGTLFTGRFDLAGAVANPTDPEQATDIGVPFIYRPTGIKLMMSYKSGDQLIRGTLKDPGNLFGGFTVENVEGEDHFKIYALLDKITGADTLKIANAELEGGSTAGEGLVEVIIPFNYRSEEFPTQISLVCTSSGDGHHWQGAIGSTLIIDDITLLYE